MLIVPNAEIQTREEQNTIQKDPNVICNSFDFIKFKKPDQKVTPIKRLNQSVLFEPPTKTNHGLLSAIICWGHHVICAGAGMRVQHLMKKSRGFFFGGVA